MKLHKIIALSTVLALSLNDSFAQKYATRMGKVSFFSTTPIENIEAFNNEAAAAVDAQTGSVLFIIPIKSFKFEKALMQEHFNEDYMESNKYPKAQFKGNISNLKEINFTKDGSYPAQVKGLMTMHGIEKQITVPGKIIIKGNSATLHSIFKVALADYNIKIPSIAKGKIAETIEITVNSILDKK